MVWVTSMKIASMAVSLLATFYVVRTLGPQNFGELSYAASIIGILGFLAAFANGNVLYRDLIRSPDRNRTLLGTAWLISFLAALGTLTLGVAFGLLIPHDLLTIYVIGILCIGQFFSPFQVIQHTFYARTDTRLLSLSQFFVHLAVSAAKVVAMFTGNGVLVLALIMVAEQVLGALVLCVLYLRTYRESFFRWHFDISYAKQLVHDSLPFVIVASSVAISGRIDQVLLKHFMDTATVGLYQAAVQLSEVWQFIPGLLLATLYPALVNAKTVSANTYRTRLYTLGGALFIYSSSAAIITTLLAPTIVPLLYGEAFTGSIPILQAYAWSIIGSVLSIFMVHLLVTENLRHVQIITGIVPMILNIALNIWWIPLFGAVGAAWATVVSYSLAPIIPLLYARIRSL